MIAEDLGLITPDVIALRDQFDLPGMRVLQFALDGDPQNPFLPQHYPEDVVAYTATHDNQTTRAWYESLSDQARQRIWDCLGHPIDASQAAWELIRLIWESKAMLAVAPVQDLLNLGAEARMNWPGRPADNGAGAPPPSKSIRPCSSGCAILRDRRVDRTTVHKKPRIGVSP